MKKLALSFLGSPQIRLDDQPVNLPTRKALALLAYVVVERREHAREQLMALFWPESDLKQAQSSLRTTLAYIRKALPRVPLRIEHDSLKFEPQQTVVDTDNLHAAVVSLNRLPLKQSAFIAPLQTVVRQFRGGFLTGLSLNDSPEFDDWVTLRREGYHQQMMQVFEALSRLQLEAGLVSEGLETTTLWLEHAPFEETVYQRQMQLYLAIGNRVAALQAYKMCAVMLSNEYGLKASAQTEVLARQAHNQSESARRVFDAEAECIALNRMATAAAQSSYDLETALNLLRQALSLAKQLENPLHLAETNWNLSHTYFYQGKLETALRHGETAVRLARQIGRADLLGRALNTIAYIELWSGSPPSRIDPILNEAIDLFRLLHQPAMEVDCLTVKANVYLSYGFPKEGLRHAAEALVMSEQIQNDWGYAAASYNMGLALLDAGDIQGAIEFCQKGISKARIAGHPPLVFFNTLVLGHAYRDAGRLDTALDVHHEASQIAETLKSPFFQLLVMTERCADFVCLEHWLDAAQCAMQLLELRDHIPYADFARWYQIVALKHVGSTDFALDQINTMREQIAQDNSHQRTRYFLERALAACADSLPDQITHLIEAERLAGEFGFFTEQTATHQVLESLRGA